MSESLIDRIKLICSKKPHERSLADIQDLQDITKSSKVYKNMIELSGELAHQLCCRFLSYEFHQSQTYIFRAGDIGTTFYTIIKGKVGIEIIQKNEETKVSKSVEVVELSDGASFGEIALEDTRPRQASVKCKENSHFLTLQKDDYNRMISKIVKEKRNNIVSFLKSLPIFHGMTRGSLSKMTYNFKEKEFIKGQLVYREKDPADELYFILEGEFLLNKKVVVNDGRQLKMTYTENYSDSIEALRQKSRCLIKKMAKVGNVAKIGIGELFGLEEKDEKTRKFSCVCCSDRGKLLYITKNEFFKRMKGEGILQYIQERISIKEQELNNRISIWKDIAEDAVSSLSPLQLRRKKKQQIETGVEEARKTPDFSNKNQAFKFFSKNDNFSNNFLYKQVDSELRRNNTPFESFKKKLVKKENSRSGNVSPLLTHKLPLVLKSHLKLALTDRNSPKLIRKTGYLTMYSMNSKPIYDVLK